jgi:hypothetical protein
MPVFTKVSCGKPGYLALLVATALAAMLGKASAACDYPNLKACTCGRACDHAADR